MFSQRGVLNLANTPAQLDQHAQRGNAMRLNGIDAELLMPEDIAKLCPGLDLSAKARFPVVGGLLQPRGGTARHDAVAWGFAHAADRLGVDIIENCEVTGFLKDGDRIVGVETSRGTIRAPKVGVAVAGMTSEVMRKAGVEKLPIESHILQAFVTEPLKPLIHCVVTFGAGHMYVSQSDKGGLVYGGNLDYYNSYAQRGNLPIVHEVASELLAVFPNVGKVRLRPELGRPRRHVDGRQPDHHDRAAARPLSELRLVLRRLQGDARLRLVLRPHDRQRRAASAQRRLHARALPPGPARSTRGAPARRRGCTRHAMLIPCPVCGLRDHGEFTYGGDATIVRPGHRRRATRRAGRPTSTTARIRAGRIRNTGTTCMAAGTGWSSRATRRPMT